MEQVFSFYFFWGLVWPPLFMLHAGHDVGCLSVLVDLIFWASLRTVWMRKGLGSSCRTASRKYDPTASIYRQSGLHYEFWALGRTYHLRRLTWVSNFGLYADWYLQLIIRDRTYYKCSACYYRAVSSSARNKNNHLHIALASNTEHYSQKPFIKKDPAARSFSRVVNRVVLKRVVLNKVHA